MENIQRNIVMFEIGILLTISIGFGNGILESIFIILEFMTIRTLLGAKHYDNQIQCLIMTTILMTSIFLVLKINFGLALVITAFASFNLSSTNINIEKIKGFVNSIFTEGFMFKRRGDSKYKNIDKFIAENPDSKELKGFEQKLKDSKDKRLYPIYKIRFYEKADDGLFVPLSYIEKKINVNHRRLVECLNKIQECFESCIEKSVKKK